MNPLRLRTSSATALIVSAVLLSSAPLRSLQGEAAEDRIITTSHRVIIDGKPIVYTARAGRLPIRDNETGDVHGRMFFVAYTVPRAPNAPPRPLTFLWNGGPGSSSSLVHLLGFGPRRLAPGKGPAPSVPIDNAGTWLDFSDLVFIDPIGTGYSRPAKAEYGPEFYQTRGDAESVAEFIRVYRNRFDAADAPLILAGESYGVTRAAGVADTLERRGIRVSAAILIGLALPLGNSDANLRTALNVPTYTATAFANRKLAADLQADLQATLRKAEAWAATKYAEALARRDALGDAERSAIITDLARFTGFDATLIDRKTLAIPMPLFSEQLLQSENRIVGRYDSRLTAPFDPGQVKMYDPTKDPSLSNIIDDVAVLRYLRSDLGYESDLPYQGPFGGGYPPPTTFRGDWMSVRWNRGPAPGTGNTGAANAGAPQTRPPAAPSAEPEPPLAHAMTLNPALKVLNACGYYDLVCSYFANEFVAGQLEPALKARVTVRGYPGGHAVYTADAVRRELKRDVAALVQSVASRPAPSKPATATPAAPMPSSSAGDGETTTTHHQISVNGRTLRYTARAGLLPIRVNETGEPHAHVFYVSYTLDGAATNSRPLTFLWN